jgi:chaperonin cofactor prefoldin
MEISVIISLIGVLGVGIAAWVRQNVIIAIVKNDLENLRQQFDEHRERAETSINKLHDDMNSKFNEVNKALTNLSNAMYQLVGKLEILEKQNEKSH